MSGRIHESKCSTRKKKGSNVSVSSLCSKTHRYNRGKRKRLFRKRNELRIIVENVDVTPIAFNSLAKYTISLSDRMRSSQIEVIRSQTTGDGVFSTMTSQVALQTQIQSVNVSIITPQTNSSSIVKTDEYASVESISWLQESEEEIENLNKMQQKIETMMPNQINVVLTETPVLYLFEQSSTTVEKDSEEGLKVEKDNEYYDYLTIGKGRNRKTVTAEVQTNATVLKSRYTRLEHSKRKNSYAFASGWDMMDTFLGISEVPQGKAITVNVPVPGDDDYIKYIDDINRQMLNLMKNPNFQNSLIVMERILANNVYNIQQKRFRGLIEQDPFRPDIAFKYNLDLLWTFKNSKTAGHPVTSMHWNPVNRDILAVGYGKFFYNDNKTGFVFCWNIKNPSQPEREYYYSKPVTSVAFSAIKPNILAVGLYDGNVNILDITKKDIVVLAFTSPHFSPSHDPIWQVAWLSPDDYHPDEEYLICVGEDGRVSRLVTSKTMEFISTPIMRTLPIEGKLKGVYQPRHCPVTDVPLRKCSAALVIAPNPADKNKYYVGTDEGSIHRCSRHYLNEHIDMFLAHNGPVYSCQFSPFCHQLFLTCGADWCINIWAESIPKPLITLTKTMEAVEGACWSPANCTIIANIVGTEIIIWDLQRRTYLPVATHKSPTNCRNTLIQFTDFGRNLVVADIEGNVHIFSLEDMPFPPFYQSEMLLQVIKKTLVTNKEAIETLDSYFKSHAEIQFSHLS